ncbi:MAG: STAS domain-containing protein [Solirubrobacteraceae bacterium]
MTAFTRAMLHVSCTEFPVGGLPVPTRHSMCPAVRSGLMSSMCPPTLLSWTIVPVDDGVPPRYCDVRPQSAVVKTSRTAGDTTQADRGSMNDASTLTIKTALDGRICTLTLSGELDCFSATGFLMHAAHVVDERTERFVLDLGGLTFLDCDGARALAIAAILPPSACPVIVRSLSPAARRVLDLLNLDLRQEPSAGPDHHDTPVRPVQRGPVSQPWVSMLRNRLIRCQGSLVWLSPAVLAMLASACSS